MSEPTIKFESKLEEVTEELNNRLIAALYEAAGEVLGQVQKNTPVDTGQLKGSWRYKVDESELKAVIGSPLENSIWNEFGTGEFALNGNGRKGGWKYKDEEGNWHHTYGKRPVRSMHNAFIIKKPTVRRIIEKSLKDIK